jgi:hypothetical protein
MVMYFGRHRGTAIRDIPTSYLRWLLTIDLDDRLRSAVRAELQHRTHTAGDRADLRALSPATAAVAEDLVGSGYRALAKAHHPDRGGSHDAMIRVNEAAAWLRARLRESSS